MENPIPKPIEENFLPFEYPIIKRILLNVPIDLPKKDFFDVVQKRKSDRTFKKIDIEVLSKILWLSAKVKDARLQANNYILTHRAVPSAGGRHPIDILVFNHNLNQAQVPYYYNPFDHSLNELLVDPNVTLDFLSHLSESFNIRNATIIWFIAEPNKTGSKYENEESLVLRDAGALIYCIQTVCTALNVNSCPFGTLGQPFIQKLLKINDSLVGMGGVAIG